MVGSVVSGVAVFPAEVLHHMPGMAMGFLQASYLEGSLLSITPEQAAWLGLKHICRLAWKKVYLVSSLCPREKSIALQNCHSGTLQQH